MKRASTLATGRISLLAIGAIAAVGGLGALRAAAAGDAATTASTATNASAATSASATTSASAAAPASGSAAEDAGPPPKLVPPTALTQVEIAGWPEERSDRPKPEAWAEATEVTLTRTNAACRAVRLREWIKITCYAHKYLEPFGARVIGGSEEGVEIEDAPAQEEKDGKRLGLSVIFPVRRGDRRTLTIDDVTFAFKAYSPDEDVMFMISELWLPDAPGPTIVVN